MTVTVRSTLGSWLRRHSLTLVATLGGAVGVAYAAAQYGPDTPARPAAPVIIGAQTPGATAIEGPLETVQIALLLDTSSSMDGLINQARSHLWKMVDDMGKMTRTVDGKTRGVRIELALYEYGNTKIDAKAGYIRQVMPFTTDLDKVSEQLDSLFTSGGDEFAGQAIQTAINDLAWSKDPAALRFVFLAGNETFNQGPVSAAAAMRLAADRDIAVQLIHCGGEDATWSAASKLAMSDLMTIDQDKVAAHIPAPQDAEILQLGGQLNSTYIAYGAEGQASLARQANADASSAKLSPKVALERSQMKAKRGYKNDRWDVVDAVENDGNWLANAKDGDLPEELRGKTIDEKKAMVAAKATERAALKEKIAKLEQERAKFLEAERARQNTADAPSLESEMLKSTKKTAARKGYKL